MAEEPPKGSYTTKYVYVYVYVCIADPTSVDKNYAQVNTRSSLSEQKLFTDATKARKKHLHSQAHTKSE